MRWLLSLILFLSITSTAQADLTSREAAELLSAAVVEYTTTRGRAHCTAFAVGPTKFMSAGHCATFSKSYMSSLNYWVEIYSVEVGVGDKPTQEGSAKDWAIATTYRSIQGVVPLDLACNEEIYVGMPVAYMGYPSPLKRFFGMGYLATLEESRASMSGADGVVDLAAAPGASGSPVISVSSGEVIGILTEGVYSSIGAFAVGIELIQPDHCPSEIKFLTVGPRRHEKHSGGN
jgi:V8-like Glu-specific endopeptidase